MAESYPGTKQWHIISLVTVPKEVHNNEEIEEPLLVIRIQTPSDHVVLKKVWNLDTSDEENPKLTELQEFDTDSL